MVNPNIVVKTDTSIKTCSDVHVWLYYTFSYEYLYLTNIPTVSVSGVVLLWYKT